MIDRLDRLNSLLNKILTFLAGASLLGLTLLATGNVLLRVFHVPYQGTYEIVAFLGALVTALALGYTQEKKSHIIVDILTEKFPRPVKKFLDCISFVLTALLFGLIAWQTFVWGFKIREAGELSETLKIIYYPFVFMTGFGFAVLSLTLVVDLLKTMTDRTKEKR